MKLLPSRCKFCVYPTTHMQSHICKVYACLAVTCHLYCSGTDTEIRVSTESWPRRRKFSRSSCTDSNPRPFSHESSTLTTELSPPLHRCIWQGLVKPCSAWMDWLATAVLNPFIVKACKISGPTDARMSLENSVRSGPVTLLLLALCVWIKILSYANVKNKKT